MGTVSMAGGLRSGYAPAPPPAPFYTVQSTSVGTSEEQFDSWSAQRSARTVPTTVISDPLRGIGPSAGTIARGPPTPVHENIGSLLRVNRLS